MEIIRCLNDFPTVEGSIVTIGSFDGIHRGHQNLLKKTVAISHNTKLPSILLTFEPHPQLLLRSKNKRPIRLLSTLAEKALITERYFNLDYFVALDFNKGFSELNAASFIKKVLIDALKAKHIIIGYDHRFGKNREGDVTLLQELGKTSGFDVTIIDALMNENQPVSSTMIRDHIQGDRLDLANAMLGHSYIIRGNVVKGMQRGRQLTFPTANIELDSSQKVVPNRGVYLVKCLWDNQSSFGMCNIGVRPTFNDQIGEVIEVHLFLDETKTAPAYGNGLTIEFLQKLSGEKKFETPEILTEQLNNDKETCMSLIENYLNN